MTADERYAQCERAYQMARKQAREQQIQEHESRGVSTWHIWSEGYAATGSSSGAVLMGITEARTFQEACDKVMADARYAKYYDAKRRTYWGCRLSDNESDARSYFG